MFVNITDKFYQNIFKTTTKLSTDYKPKLKQKKPFVLQIQLLRNLALKKVKARFEPKIVNQTRPVKVPR